MHVLIADLDEDAAGFGEEVAGDGQAVAEVGQVAVDAQFPRVAERLHLLGLSRRVFGLAVFHVPLACADLPVRPELDAVGWVEVDRLHLPFEPFLLGQAGHDGERVAEDHAVGPVRIVLVELDFLVEAVEAVEVGEQVELLLGGPGDVAGEEVVDEGLRVQFFLDVNGDHRDGQGLPVLLVLPLPHQLRIERQIPRIKHRLRLLLDQKVAQLLRRNILPRILMLDGLNGGGSGGLFLGHVLRINQ